MNSRMEKYYKEEVLNRSSKNKDLYKSIYEENDYEDINIAPKTRTINMNELRQMVSNKQPSRLEKKEIKPISIEEDKVYDLNETLDKAKESYEKDDKKRSLSNTQYDILKNLKVKDNGSNDLRELIDTISTKHLIDEDKDLFDDLKSLDDTTVGVPSDINGVFKDETRKMDETFFTKSMKLDTNDFETINTGIEKNNKMMKMLFILIIILIVIVLGIIIVVLI